MKRVYSNQNNNKKGRELRKLVLKQLMQMRKKMQKEHPKALEKLALLSKMQGKQAQSVEQEDLKSKNLETVNKMLEIGGKNKEFKKAIRKMIAES